MIAAVTVDLDGTLYELRQARLRVLWATFGRWRALRVGMRVREELRGQRFVNGAALLRAEAELAAPRLELEPAAARAALDRVFDDDLVRVLRAIGPMRGARAALELLVERGLPLAVVSDRGQIAQKLNAIGLGDLPWRALVSAEERGVLKPDRALLDAAAAAMGVDVTQVLHVGDRVDADGGVAKNAGAAFALVGGAGLPGWWDLEGLKRLLGA